MREWEEMILSDVGKIVTGNTPSKKHPEYYGDFLPWVKPGDIRKSNCIKETKEYLSELGKDHARLLPKGSIMVTCIGDLGNVAIAERELATNQQINSVIPDPEVVIPKFLFYAMQGLKPWLVENSTSTTISMVNKGNFSKAPVRIPEKNIQRQIVAHLDAFFARHAVLRSSLSRLPALVADFREAVLHRAVTGELTKEWRKSMNVDAKKLLDSLQQAHVEAGGHKKGNAATPDVDAHELAFRELPNSWSRVQVRELCRPDSPITYGILKPGPETPGGVPYLKVASYPGNKLDFKKVRHTSEEIAAKYTRATLAGGDIVLSIRGTVGRAIIVPDELTGANLTQDSARIRPQDGYLNDFLLYVLLSSECQKTMKRVAKGVAVKGINIGDVRFLNVPLPPLVEQHEIVRRIESLFAVADRLEERMAVLQRQVEDLPQAVLGAVFGGGK